MNSSKPVLLPCTRRHRKIDKPKPATTKSQPQETPKFQSQSFKIPNLQLSRFPCHSAVPPCSPRKPPRSPRERLFLSFFNSFPYLFINFCMYLFRSFFLSYVHSFFHSFVLYFLLSFFRSFFLYLLFFLFLSLSLFLSSVLSVFPSLFRYLFRYLLILIQSF